MSPTRLAGRCVRSCQAHPPRPPSPVGSPKARNARLISGCCSEWVKGEGEEQKVGTVNCVGAKVIVEIQLAAVQGPHPDWERLTGLPGSESSEARDIERWRFKLEIRWRSLRPVGFSFGGMALRNALTGLQRVEFGDRGGQRPGNGRG